MTYPTMRAYLMQAGRAYIESVIAECDGDITAAAKMAGRNRTDFYRLMRRHGLEPARSGKGRRGNAQWQALSRPH